MASISCMIMSVRLCRPCRLLYMSADRGTPHNEITAGSSANSHDSAYTEGTVVRVSCCRLVVRLSMGT